MSNNKDVFAELLNYTIPVQLQGGSILTVRRVPFTTTLRTLSTVATMLHTELLAMSQGKIGNLLDTLVDSNSVLTPVETGMLVIERAFPVVMSCITNSPSLLMDILKDIIPDATKEDIAMLSTEDGLLIISTAFAAMDKAVIATQVSQIFFGLSGVVRMVLPAKKEAQEPPSAPLPSSYVDVQE